jgi:hypothetical protein
MQDPKNSKFTYVPAPANRGSPIACRQLQRRKVKAVRLSLPPANRFPKTYAGLKLQISPSQFDLGPLTGNYP